MRRTVRARAGAAGAALSLMVVLGACGGGNESADGDDPLHVLYVGPKTGALSVTGDAIERGAKAAVDELNANGGIQGRKVELTEVDDQSDPTRAVSAVQDAVQGDKKPDLIIAGVSSNEALAVAPLLTRSKIIGIASAASPAVNDPEKYPYFFSQAFPTTDSIAAGAEFIQDNGGAKRVALIAASDAIGDATEASSSEAFKAAGISTRAFRFDPKAVDITPVFQKAASFKPDWIYMEGSGSQTAVLLDGRTKAGLDEMPTVLGPTGSSLPLHEIATDAQRENLYATLPPNSVYVDPADRTDEFSAFLKRINDQGKLATTPYMYSVGWDNVMIWAKAAEKVDGDITGDAVKKILESEEGKEDGAQFPVYSGAYTPDNHMHSGANGDFTFGRVTGLKEDAVVIK